jgi:hypothetical protein
MDKRSDYVFRLLLMMTMVTGAGCQTVVHKMSPPESLKEVPPVTVQRAGPLWLSGIMTAGPWKMTNVSVGFGGHWCSHHLFSADSIDRNTYALTVNSQNRVLRAGCKMKRTGRFYFSSDEPSDGTESSTFDCNFSGFDTGNLHLITHSDGTKHGEVTYGALKWDVHSVHVDDTPDVSFMPLGYEVWDGDNVIAAVELFREGEELFQPPTGGRIWIKPSLSDEDQQRVVVLAGGLLLYQPTDGQPLMNCD